MSPNCGTGTDKVTSFRDWIVQTSGRENGKGHRIIILIQSYNFQLGKELLAISQKQATTPNFAEHQVAE